MLTSVNLGVVIHGMAISKELIDMFHKCGTYICYNDLLLLYAIRALQDAETSKTCPRGIVYGKSLKVVVDNDDFKIETPTGNVTSAYRTNMLYAQPL